MQPTEVAPSMLVAPGTPLFDRVMGSGVWVAQEKLDGVRAVWVKSRFWSRHGKPLQGHAPNVGTVAVIDGEMVRVDGVNQWLAFDLLELDGQDLRSRPWSERWMRLQNLGLPTVETVVDGKRGFWERCMERGAEGIVLKHMRDPYPPIDGAVWYKVKR